MTERDSRRKVRITLLCGRYSLQWCGQLQLYVVGIPKHHNRNTEVWNILDFGKPHHWDANAVHDPYALVYRGKIYLYYKGSLRSSISQTF